MHLQEAEAKKKEVEEEEKRKKEEAADKSADKIADKLGDAVSALVDKLPFLQPVQPYLTAAVDFLAPRPYVLYAAAALPALGLLFTIFGALFGGKKVRCRAASSYCRWRCQSFAGSICLAAAHRVCRHSALASCTSHMSFDGEWVEMLSHFASGWC